MPTSARLRWLLPSFLLLAPAACRKPNDAAPAPDASVVAVKDASAAPVAKTADAGVSPKAGVQALRELNEGRKLARAKQWSKAIEAFDRAIALSPDEPALLSEIGYAALQSNDLKRAESANKRALELTHDPKLRAQVLYNSGRVAEARGDKDAARKAYGESVALRDNAEVKKRLTALGGDDEAGMTMPCPQAFDTVKDLCACVVKGTQDNEPSTCKVETDHPPLGDARLGVIGWEYVYENSHYLTVTEGGKVRVLTPIGRTFEPGAFGVHVNAEITGAEKRKVGEHDVVVLRWNQHASDADMAGLLLTSTDTKNETVCVVGTALGASNCTPPLTIVEDYRSGPNDFDPGDLDPEAQAQLEELKKENGPPVKTHVTGTWSIGTDGVVTARAGAATNRYVLWK